MEWQGKNLSRIAQIVTFSVLGVAGIMWALTNYGAHYMTQTPYAKPEKLLRLPEVESLTGLKKSSIYAGMKAGTFPHCIRLSVRAVAWPESRIATWQAQRQQAGAAHD